MPQSASLLDQFIRTYSAAKQSGASNPYRFPTLLRHNGTVIAFAMDSKRRIFYAILDFSTPASTPASGASAPPDPFDVNSWSPQPLELLFPNEIAEVGFGVADQVVMPAVRLSNGDFAPNGTSLEDPTIDRFLSSTARLTANAPFQVLSDGTHVYVFRQSEAVSADDHTVKLDAAGRVFVKQGSTFASLDAAGTTIHATVGSSLTSFVDSSLLVDRFVFNGTALVSKQEARFQRSRSKTRPQSRKDSLGAADLDGNPFLEPTQKLRFVGHLTGGRFTVLLLPTQAAGIQRWQIFTQNADTKRIECFNVERSSDGLFNTRGSQLFTCVDHDDFVASAPGVCPRPSTTDPSVTCNKNLIPLGATSGDAGAALTFDAVGAFAKIGGGNPVNPGSSFTFETWIRLNALPPADVALISVSGGAADNGPSIVIAAPSKLRISAANRQFTTDSLFAPNQWTHLAVTYDGTNFRVYLNGLLSAKSDPAKLAATPAASASGFGFLGDLTQNLNANLEEIRIWSRVLDAQEVRDFAHVRRTGLEPGMVAYWPCDEGSGTNLFDQGPNALPVTPLSGTSWLAVSDAQIGETPGVSRGTLQISGRTVQSGFASLLYFEQVNTPSGYSGVARPLKQSGRVLLAFASNAPGDAGNPIAVIDWAVSVDGRLAETPEIIALSGIAPTATATALPMNSIGVDSRGLSVSGGVLTFASAADTPSLFDSASGLVTLYFCGQNNAFEAAYYQTLVQPAVLTLNDAAGNASLSVRLRSTGPEAAAFSMQIADPAARANASVCDLTIATVQPGNQSGATETWKNVPRDANALAVVLMGKADTRARVGKASLNVAPSGTATLAFSADGLSAAVAKGAILRVGDFRVSAGAEARAGDGVLVVNPESRLDGLTPEPLPVFLVTYDYEFLAQSSNTLADLSTGSQLVAPAKSLSGQPLANTAAPAQSSGAVSGQWIAQTPGQALALTKSTSVESGPNIPASNFDTAGDLTVEAWVNPVSGSFPILRHKSDNASYSLHTFQRVSLFDLRKEGLGVEISDTGSGLNISNTQDFTVEAWIKPPFEVDSGIHRADVIVKGSIGDLRPFSLVFDSDASRIVASRSDGANTPTLQVELINTGAPAHVAFVKQSDRLFLYVDGLLQGQTKDTVTGPTGNDRLRFGFAAAGGGHFNGTMDEVRIWSRARTGSEIAQGRFLALHGSEANLVGYWHFDTFEFSDAEKAWIVKDSSGNKNDGKLLRQSPSVADLQTPPALSASPLPLRVTAAVNGLAVQSDPVLPTAAWTHIAAAFSQRYGLQFDGTGYLDAGHDSSLNLTGDMTVEVFLLPQALSQQRFGILTKRTDPSIGGAQGVPYSLYVDGDSSIVFAFDDTDGGSHLIRTDSLATKSGMQCLAVTRKTTVSNSPEHFTDTNTKVVTTTTTTCNIYVSSSPDFKAGTPIHTETVLNKSVAASKGPLEIGRSLIGGAGLTGFNGFLGEVRVWSKERDAAVLGAAINGDEDGLVSWWKLNDNTGTVAADSKSSNHAKLHGGAAWVKNPSFTASTLKLYVNGGEVPVSSVADVPPSAKGFRLGADPSGASAAFEFSLDEVRVWKTRRTQLQIQDNLFTRLLGEKDDLLAYYTFSNGLIADGSPHANGLNSVGANFVSSTAPLGVDAPQIRGAFGGVTTDFNGTLDSVPSAAEYGTVEHDAAGNLLGVLKRAYSFIHNGDWKLITAFKVGDLVTEWVGQVQTAPQLFGYIEGAPPVPSENLTGLDNSGNLTDYSGACSVAFTEAENRTFTYSTSVDTGLNIDFDFQAGLGIEAETKAGIGVEQTVVKLKAAGLFSEKFSISTSSVDRATASVSRGDNQSTRLGLSGRGTRDVIDANNIRQRFQPDNIGLALVQSATADVFALRLRHNDALIAYSMRPNPDIPKDWNLIEFPINPTYTKQGTLDGKLGFAGGRFQTDSSFPNALAPGSNASYFKPIEAYALKNRIERDQTELATFYRQYSAAPSLQPGKVPNTIDLFARNLVNTYVWTAGGGLFAESQSTLDSVSSEISGTYNFQAQAGLHFEFSLQAPLGPQLALNALFGGHINVTATKNIDSSSGFSLDISLDNIERNIFGPGAGGALERRPGTVDAYRFLSFYLQSDSDNGRTFFNTVADPIWLAQSSDAAAVALRSAQSANAAPACWRVMHRVTFVSRVLPKLFDASAPPTIEKALRTLDIDSNFELIEILEPLVRNSLNSLGSLAAQVANVLPRVLPELVPHTTDIVNFLAEYFGVLDDALDADRASGASTVAPAPNQAPVVRAGPPLRVGLNGAFTSIQLSQASAVDDRLDPSALFITWKPLSGPAPVTFTDPHLLQATATFTARGVYSLRVTASDGRLSSFSDTTVTVDQPPVVSLPADRISVGSDSDGKHLAQLAATLVDDGLAVPAEHSVAIQIQWTKLRGLGTVAFDRPGSLTTNASFSDTGFYLLQVTVANANVRDLAFTVNKQMLVSVAARALGGLQVLYTFKEGSGTTVFDVSNAAPLDLTLAGGGVAFTGNALRFAAPPSGTAGTAATAGSASRLSNALSRAGEVTVEAWIVPAVGSQGGLARIVTLSAGPGARDFILGQSQSAFHAGFRTSTTDANATTESLAAGVATAGVLTHLACTRDKAGNVVLYIDGRPAGSRRTSGDFSTWDNTFRLVLGNEINSTNPSRRWLGDLHILAIYSRALTATEILQNFQFGADTDSPPMVSAGDSKTAQLKQSATSVDVALLGGVTPDRPSKKANVHVVWEQISGPPAPPDNPASAVTAVHPRQKGVYTYRLTADDGKLVSIDEARITVDAAPVVQFTPPPALIALPANRQLIPVSASIVSSGYGDPAGDTGAALGWVQLPPNAPIVAPIDNSSSPNAAILFRQRGDYSFQLVAAQTDVNQNVQPGALQTQIRFDVTVCEQPVILAGADQIVKLPEAESNVAAAGVGGPAGGAAAPKGKAVVLTGAVTDSGLPNNRTTGLRFAWTCPQLPNLAPILTQTATVTLFDSGVYTFTFTVNNGALESTASVNITANRPPTVDIGPDLSTLLGTAVELDATVADDGLPNPPGVLTYVWSDISNVPNQPQANFENPNLQLTPVRFPVAGAYRLQLMVSDGGAQTPATVNVAVHAPPTLEIAVAPAVLLVADQPFLLRATVTTDNVPDPQAGPFVLHWTASGPSALDFQPNNAADTLVVCHTPGVYTVRLEASNRLGTFASQRSLDVLGFGAGPAQSVTLTGSSITVTLAGIFVDQQVAIIPASTTFAWSAVSGPAAATPAAPGDIATTVVLTARGVYVFQLTATRGARSASSATTITVS